MYAYVNYRGPKSHDAYLRCYVKKNNSALTRMSSDSADFFAETK